MPAESKTERKSTPQTTQIIHSSKCLCCESKDGFAGLIKARRGDREDDATWPLEKLRGIAGLRTSLLASNSSLFAFWSLRVARAGMFALTSIGSSLEDLPI
jgi:hypothetical protein